MLNFMKKTMDWVIDKERDAAKNCYIHTDDIDKQIEAIQRKRDTYKKEYEDNMAEMEHILDRLNKIKINTTMCDTK